MKLMLVGIRKAILSLESYTPGKPIAELKREIPTLAHKRIIKLASNENPIGPSPKALGAIKKAISQLHRYPEGSSPVLRGELAKYHSVSQEQLIVGSGADEILRVIVETLLEPKDTIVASQWSFSRFRQHARLMGSRVVEVPMKDYTHDILAMANAARKHKAKIVFVANPNNPTGTFNTKVVFERFLEELGNDGPWVVSDEAYAHFAKDIWGEIYPEAVLYFKSCPKLIAVRTFSKIVGLAGLRIGYALGHLDLIEKMNRARLVFNVNTLGQIAAAAALKDTIHIRRTLGIVREGRYFLTRELKALGFFVVEPNAANFLFARIPKMSGFEFYQALLKEGIIIRPVGERGLENFVRITIGNLSDNRALIKAIKKIL